MMTIDEARRIVRHQPKACLKNMAFALTLMAWRNTEEEWQRLEAAVVLLGRSAPARAREFVKQRQRVH